jgi:hypothetical protein
MPETCDLLALQRDFLSVLREPLLGEGRAATALPPRSGEPSREFEAVAERHLTASRALDSHEPLQPVERLDLYHRQYWYRVLDSLEEDFPALKVMLGDDDFRTLLEAYLEATPSRSGTLRHLGSQLPAFLASHPQLAGRQTAAAIELAQLEYALCLAFEAGEREPADAAQFEEGRVTLQPHVQVFALRTTADEFWRHAVGGAGAARPAAAETACASRFVVVYRDGFHPTMEAVEAAAFRLLATFRDGATLADAIDSSGLVEGDSCGFETTDADACGRAASDIHAPEETDADAPGSTAEAAARLQRWFSQWASRGWLIPSS